MSAPMPEMLMVAERGEVIATVRKHQDIVEVFRLMRQRLGLTNEFIDDVGGLTKGHTDKILGPSESKSWGPTTFDLFCEMFAIEFRVHIDLAAVQRMEAVWEGHERPRWFPAEKMNNRVSQKLIERATPHVFRAAGRSGGLKRAASLPAKLRSRIAKKAGKSRMKKATKTERSVMMKKGWETRRRRITEAQLIALAALAAAESGSICPVGDASTAAVAAISACDCAE